MMGHGGYLGPDYTAEYLRLSADHVGQELRDSGSRDPTAGRSGHDADQPLRRGTGEPRVHRRAGERVREDARRTTPTSSAPTRQKHGLIPTCHHRPAGDTRPDRVLQLDRLGQRGRARGTRLLLHQQLATGTARRQHPDRRHPGLVGVVADRPAGWARGTVRALRAVEPQDRLARHRNARRWPSVSRARCRSRPSQKATAWFFFVVAVLFLGQAVLGGAIEHYRAELSNFFGFDLAQILPFNLARTWHVQLSLLWTAAAFLAAGIFLAPIISGREPRRQSLAGVRAARARCSSSSPAR